MLLKCFQCGDWHPSTMCELFSAWRDALAIGCFPCSDQAADNSRVAMGVAEVGAAHTQTNNPRDLEIKLVLHSQVMTNNGIGNQPILGSGIADLRRNRKSAA